jgi:hypothetical protein
MRFLLAAACTLSLSVAASAQPTVEVRLRGINDLLDRVEYLSKLVDQEDAGNQLAQTVQSFADDKKGIEGIDPARPVGLYATVAPDLLGSQAVAILPIADEDTFLGLLEGKLSLSPKKQDDGTYSLSVPGVPLPVFFRFAERSCYVTVAGPAALAPKALVSPKAFFADADPAVLAVRLRLDTLPADLRTMAVAQMELKLADAKAETVGESAGQTALKGWVLDRLAEAAAAVLTDGKELRVRLLADPKADDLGFEVSLTGTPGSTLASTIAGLGGKTTTAAVPAADAVATLGLSAAVGPKAAASLAPVVDALIADAVKQAKGAEKIGVKLVLDALAPTLKRGLIDFNAAVLPADGNKLRVLAAVAVAEGKKIEETAKVLLPVIPEKDVKAAFDQGTAGGLTLHTLTVGGAKFAAPFGTDRVWLATGDKKLVVGVEPGGDGVKTVAVAEPRPTPVFAAEVSVARLLALTPDALPAAAGMKLVTTVFGDAGPAGNDTASVRLEGGDGLRLRLTVRGKALHLAALTDRERKKAND